MTRSSSKSKKPGDLRPATQLEEAQIFSVPEGSRFDARFDVRSPETSAERASREKKEAREFWIREAPIHIIAIFIAVSGSVAALVMTFRPGSSVEDKKWAMSILTHLLIAVAGFAFGKAAK